MVLADFEGCLSNGTELSNQFVATWYYMPISIIAHFASLHIPSKHSVNEVLHAAVAKVVDTGKPIVSQSSCLNALIPPPVCSSSRSCAHRALTRPSGLFAPFIRPSPSFASFVSFVRLPRSSR